MEKSHVIEVAGYFAGAAVSHEGRFRFVAVDARVEELDSSLWPTVSDVRRVVSQLMRTGLLPPRSTIQLAPRQEPTGTSDGPRRR